jgi:hypothetical protein
MGFGNRATSIPLQGTAGFRRRSLVTVYCRLLKPRCTAPATGGEEQIAISVEKLDGRAVTLAVGVGEMYRGGDYTVVDKGAVLVKAVPLVPERVILSAWLALPRAILVRVRITAACVGSHGAVGVKRHYGRESRQHLVRVITVDPMSGVLPHPHDCRGCFSHWSVRAPHE